MTRPPRESLDYDTWLQQRAALTDDDYRNEEEDERTEHPERFAESDDNVPDEADTDPDYGD